MVYMSQQQLTLFSLCLAYFKIIFLDSLMSINMTELCGLGDWSLKIVMILVLQKVAKQCSDVMSQIITYGPMAP